MRNCRITGLDYVREAHAKGKGVLILTLHMGNWEFLPISFISQGFKVTPLYRPLDSEPIDRFILTYRQRFGGKPISKRNSMRKILSALKRQECVGILLDQNTERKSSVFVDFFGHPASTNKGLALIALKTGAPVLPVYIVSCGMRYEVVVGPQIPLINSGRKEDDILANTQAYNRIIESIIRKHPEQWLWIHQRWKTRPIEKKDLKTGKFNS
jgi:KDO2-lipid IV(A) lauroyltransferase